MQLQNANGCPADISIVVSAPWLIAPAGGTVPAYGSVGLTVRVDAAALPGEEGDYPATLTVSGPANALTVTVTARRGGQPPQILSASATCTAAGGLTILAQAVDDVAVTRVTASFTRGGEAETVELAPTGGLGWRAEASATGGVGPITITAFDGAGRQASMGIAPVGCGG